MFKRLVVLIVLLMASVFVYSQETNMVFVRGGSFVNTRSNYYNTDTTVSDFWISKYEVTQAEWQAVMGNNPSSNKGDNLPVTHVSWYDSVEYCNARSLRESLNPVYTIEKSLQDSNNTNSYDQIKWIVTANRNANGYRLPTEAEWEYAAGGGQSSRSFTYSGSNNLFNIAWYFQNSFGKTHAVGTKMPNELGIYDMSGNVYEWCWDWHNQSFSIGVNPSGNNSGSCRISRGGSYDNFGNLGREFYLLSTTRNKCDPSSMYINTGIRVVRSSF